MSNLEACRPNNTVIIEQKPIRIIDAQRNGDWGKVLLYNQVSENKDIVSITDDGREAYLRSTQTLELFSSQE